MHGKRQMIKAWFKLKIKSWFIWILIFRAKIKLQGAIETKNYFENYGKFLQHIIQI